TARAYPAACAFAGKIYVFGGHNRSGAVNSVQVYDTASNTWTTPTVTGTFTPRGALGSGALNGKIFTVGGSNGGAPLNVFEMFDPATYAWSSPTTRGTFSARYSFGSCVSNDKIYAIGGSDGNVELSTNEAFSMDGNAVGVMGAMSPITFAPNPTKGLLRLHNLPLDAKSISIRNMLGVELLAQNPDPNCELSIDLSGLPFGVYYLCVSSTNKITTHKIVRE
ncbi:MAG: kelch repeat-containing protein, partial [Candidatus Kapaibacterium sp.]